MKRTYFIISCLLVALLGGLSADYLLSDGTADATPGTYLQQVEAAIDEKEDGGALAADYLRKGFLKGQEMEVLCLLLRKEGTLPQLRQLVAEGLLPVPPATLTSADGSSKTPLQLVAGSSQDSAPDTLRWLFEQGHSQVEAPSAALNACVKSMQWFSYGLGPEVDGMIRSGLACLEVLLEHGARHDADTRELLPVDARLKEQIVEMMQNHGSHIMAGETCKGCCAP